jgi:lipid II:glycine glycyltransferase (peptidoglycan interpeptide bridge formation enzyme)
MTVHEIDPLSDPRWEALVNRHPAASVFHTPAWLQALKQTYGYEPSALTVFSTGGSLTNGLVFCRVNSWMTGRRLVSLPFSDHCEPLGEDAETVRVLVSGLTEKAREEGARYLELRPINSLERVTPSPYASSNYYLHQLDLRPGLEAVSGRFHKDCIQRKIRRSEREFLRVAEGRTPELLNQFYNLVVRTRRRQGLPPQPLKWFQTLTEFGPDVQVRIASKNDQPIAGILTMQHNRSLVYKYGASDERFHNLGGMVYLFWVAIQEAIGHGLEELDMGRSDLDQEGLIRFKEHWGATRRNLCYWRCPATRAVRATQKLDITRRLLSILPAYPLKLAGRLLYRHIG